jgi:hypothetical protein
MVCENELGNDDNREILKTERESVRMISPVRQHVIRRHFRLPTWLTVTVAVSCATIILTTSLDPGSLGLRPPNSISGLKQSLSNPVPPPEFPYLVAPDLYPSPSNLAVGSPPSLVRLAATPTGTDYMLFVNDSGKQLWLAPGANDPSDAIALFNHAICINPSGTCIPTRSVYLTWGQPVKVFQVSRSGINAITADSVVAVGSELTVGVTDFFQCQGVCSGGQYSNTTEVFGTGNGGSTFTFLGSASGTLTSLTANPSSVLAATVNSGTLYATTMSAGGGVVYSVAVGPSGGIQNASASWVATPAGVQDEAIVASDPGTGSVLAFTSTNQGRTFSSGVRLGVLNQSPPSTVLNAIGETGLVPPGGLVGQVASTSVGGEVFLLFTNRTLNGRITPETEVSPDGGAHWQGPYIVPTTSGSVQDPTLAPNPDGDVMATWRDNGNGSWQVDQAVFSANGLLRASPAALPASGGNALSGFSAGPPAATVDWLARPLYAWTVPSSLGNEIDYSGEFLSASNSLNVLDKLVNDPLQPADFSSGTNATLTAFVTSTDANLTKTSTSITSGSLNAAQYNVTQRIIPAVTRIALTVTGGLPQPPPSTSTLADALGTFSPNVYLAVSAAQLLNSLGGGVTVSPLVSANAFGMFTGPPPPASVSWTQSEDGEPASVAVTAIPQSPDTILLSTTPNFPTYYYNSSGNGPCGGHEVGFTIYYDSVPVDWWSNVSIPGLVAGTFSSTSTLPSVFLTNITANTNVSWSGTFAAAYAEFYHYTYCSTYYHGQVPDTLGPLSISASISGYAITTLGIIPNQPYLLNGVWSGSSVPPTLTAVWNNSMLAEDSIWLNYTSGLNVASWSSSGYSIYQNPTFSGLSNSTYWGQIYAQSPPGTYTSSERPALSYGDTNPYPTQQATYTCDFDLSPPNYHVWWSGKSNVTNNTTSSSQITWSASADGLGSITYYDWVTGVNYTISNVPATLNRNGTWSYTVVLHNLDSFGVYWVTVGVGVGSGCLQKTLVKSFSFQTQHVLTLFEIDYPYDSITKTGGGAGIMWQVPESFVNKKPGFVSGALSWSNSSSSVQIPITSLPEFDGLPDTGLANLSALPQVNSSYRAWVDLNFTLGSTPVNVTSVPVSFVYLRDTSGDGLSDLEKALGWTSPTIQGRYYADPSLFATNGLVGDFVEKDYGLNPNTIDTANSHMLDTWNLTFNLQPGGGALPSGSNFQVWYENSTYKPFATTVQYSPGLHESGGPVAKNITNISASGTITSGDGAPWAARALWNYSALQVFDGLPGVRNAGWLRAIEGTWKGLPTLTVEGKLSWGANPLVASTPNDGLPDGERVNPLYDVGLEFQSVYANLTGLGSGNVGDGYAVRIFDNYTDNGGTARCLDNYSSQALYGNSSYPDVTNYVTTLPVSQTQQKQQFSLEVAENLTGWPQPAYINGSQTEVTLTYDLVQAGKLVVNVAGTHSGGHSTLYGVFKEVPIGAKAPTWLWVPTDNGTVNGLPVGLERYTGEQSFDLVVVNASKALTSDPIPLPWGGTSTGVTLSTGMNDFLVPREQFLDSPFGAAIFLGKSTSFNGSRALPLVSTTEQGYLTGFNGANLMVDLDAYWQNRAIASGPGNITGSWETGTPQFINHRQNALVVQVLAAPSASGANTGGLPSNPSLYSTLGDPSALQSIVTLNITSTDTFDLLLAALIDNTTGGANAVNGTLQSVTNQIGFLGLNPTVVNAISNATDLNNGLYGPPASQFPPPQPSGFWNSFWNAVTSFITNPLGTILSLVDTVWNAAKAAFSYFNHLAHEATAIGGQLLARAAGTLVSLGDRILSVLDTLLSYILSVVKAALAPVIDPIVNSAKSFDQSLGTASNATIADVAGGGSVTTAHGLAWARSFDPAAYLGVGLAIAISIALGILIPFSLGAGLLITALLSLLPQFGQYLLTGVPSVTSLSSQAVYALESGLTNSIPKIDWTALGESVGIAASSTDFAWWTLAATSKLVIEGGAAIAVATTMIIDAIILLVTLSNAMLSSPYVDGAILVLALFGGVMATSFLLSTESSSVKPYAAASVAMAALGLGATYADLKAEQLVP